MGFIKEQAKKFMEYCKYRDRQFFEEERNDNEEDKKLI